MWTGIAFSKNPFMPRTDLVVGYIDDDGTGVVKDMWLRSYVPPTEDDEQNIQDAEIRREDGVNILRFKKTLTSGDNRDVDLTDPVHLFFPVSGGPVARNFVGRHLDTPVVMPEKITLKECSVKPRDYYPTSQGKAQLAQHNALMMYSITKM